MFVERAVDSQAMSVGERCCTTRFENTHGTGFRELLYRWHPWSGLRVCVHEATDKADGIVFRCTLSGSNEDRGLEVPAWMFDRAACADQATLSANPFVDMAALSALASLLTDVLKACSTSSNAPVSGASRASRDQNRGEAHVREESSMPDTGTAEPDEVRSAAQAAANGSVRKRPVQRRDRRAMAGPSGGDTGRADQLDRAADPGASRQAPDRRSDVGRP